MRYKDPASQMTVNQARSQIQNSSFSGNSGALGVGDRGAWQSIPNYTGNPYDSNDYIYRWRQYVRLYMTSWEARKIIRIPVEDALRKDWELEGIDDKIARTLKTTLDQLRFRQVLSRSLMLERLLGGCLTFMGIEDSVDDPEKPYHPRRGQALKFLNAIPLSRIARITWDNNPLSPHYMRPYKYLINSETVHVSRCLVWDGDPLFDPYDFLLNDFRSNLAGFGPSVLATVWDDIVKAVGTRQAAYQMIQTNNAIIMAVEQLRDLKGTNPGNESLKKLEEIANNLSVYRAAVVDGKKVDIKSHSASFGSVPELLLTFIQVLSAASDIPATRFIGQAPGGLNATGESDLENYYNTIDAMQHQRIEPAIRRTLDVVGYNKFGEVWHKERENLIVNFPPLWNASELEESQKNSGNIDNVMKLLEQGLITDEKAIEEINAKKALSVILDETDIALMDGYDENGYDVTPTPHGGGEEGAAGSPPAPSSSRAYSSKINRLKNAARISDGYDDREWAKGMRVEREHDDVTGGDEEKVALIVKAHLDEAPDYYSRLEKVENEAPDQKVICVDFDGTIADYSDGFQGEDVFGKPLPSAAKTLGALKDMGCKIIIFTCRQATPALYRYLAVNEIPFDEINSNPDQPANTNEGKPVADVYLDDKAVPFTDWNKAKKDIIEAIQNSLQFDTDLTRPTKSQAEAGNYKKHHIKLHGLDFAIENPKGSERRGEDAGGKLWASIAPAHYGYIKRTEGADGDEVDAYIGPWEDSELVFIVDQLDPESKAFDEHKVIFGCLSMLQAKELYLSGFGDGKAEARLGAITPTTVSGVTEWLKKDGRTKEPFNNACIAINKAKGGRNKKPVGEGS